MYIRTGLTASPVYHTAAPLLTPPQLTPHQYSEMIVKVVSKATSAAAATTSTIEHCLIRRNTEMDITHQMNTYIPAALSDFP